MSPSFLHGRRPEQHALDRLLEQAASGRGGSLVLRGPAGIGKTALLDHAAGLVTAADNDWQVLRASGVPAEQTLSFASLQWLLQPLIPRLDGLPTEPAQILRSLLSAQPGSASGAPTSSPGVATGPSVHAALALLARDQPLLVVLDRVEWVDRASLDAVAFAARRVGHDRLAFLLALRSPTPGQAGTPHGPEGLDELDLGGLEPQDAAGLLADRFPDLAARRRSEVAAAADGNPLALLELPAGLDDDQRAGVGGPGLPPGLRPVRSPLQDEIVTTVAALPEPTRELLLLLAASGGELELASLHRAGAALGVTLDDTVRLEEVNLAAVHGSDVVLSHPLIAPAIYRAASVTRRTRAHQLLAAAADDDTAGAWHLAAASLEPDAEVATRMAATAEEALHAGRSLEATAAYERASALDSRPYRRATWLVAGAEAAVLAGLPRRAVRLADAARATGAVDGTGGAADGEPIGPAARLVLLDAVLADPPHDHRRRHQRLVDAAARPGLDTPDTAASLLGAATENAWYLGDGDLARSTAARIDAPVTVDGTGATRSATTAHALAALVAGDTGPALEALRPTLEAQSPADHDGPWREDLTALVPDPAATGPAETSWPPEGLPADRPGTGSPATTGRPAPGHTAERPVAEPAETTDDTTRPRPGPTTWGNPVDDALVVSSLGACTDAGAPGRAYHRALQALLDGRFDRAAREANGALLLLSGNGDADPSACCLLHRADRPHWLARVGGILAWLCAVEGARERCRSLAVGSLELGRTPLATPATAVAHWALALLDLGEGHHEEALVRLGELGTGSARHLVTAHHALPDQIEAAVRTGQQAAATDALGRFMVFAEQSRQPWVPAVVARCRALAEPHTDPDKLFTEAVTAHGRADQPYELARTRLAYGEWLRRMSRRRDARPHLQAAADLFDHLGAVPWADRAHNELRAAGYLTRARTEADPAAEAEDPLSRLTSQELQVVQLAATGATNREIGARLYLSPRTVAYHLYKAFPKLKVTSRHELARLVT